MKRKPAQKKVKTEKNKKRLLARIFPFLFVVALAALVSYLLPIKPEVECANSLSCDKSMTLTVENDAVGVFNNHVVYPPQITLNENYQQQNVLGDETNNEEKRIYVDLTTQTLTAFQGNTLILKTLISSGKWRDTPPGEYTIWIKLKATRMSGGEGDDYYNLPNVPYVMFFSNDKIPKSLGFSLHGAYWHNNFGHAMSHGCVNMRTIDAKTIYDWADPATQGNTTYADAKHPGTKIIITGVAP